MVIICLQTDCVEYAETGQPRVPLSSKREVSHKTEEKEMEFFIIQEESV